MNGLTRRAFMKTGAASAALGLNSTLIPIPRAKEGENRSSQDRSLSFRRSHADTSGILAITSAALQGARHRTGRLPFRRGGKAVGEHFCANARQGECGLRADRDFGKSSRLARVVRRK